MYMLFHYKQEYVALAGQLESEEGPLRLQTFAATTWDDRDASRAARAGGLEGRIVSIVVHHGYDELELHDELLSAGGTGATFWRRSRASSLATESSTMPGIKSARTIRPKPSLMGSRPGIVSATATPNTAMRGTTTADVAMPPLSTARGPSSRGALSARRMSNPTSARRRCEGREHRQRDQRQGPRRQGDTSTSLPHSPRKIAHG